MMAHIFNVLALQLFKINSRTSGLITIALQHFANLVYACSVGFR